MIALLINPTAGKNRAGRHAPAVIDSLSKKYPELVVFHTSSPGEARQFVRQNVSVLDLLFVMGGDGTLNEVVNGNDSGTSVKLIPIPSGSGNDFCRAVYKNQKFDFSFSFLSKPVEFIQCDLGHVSITTDSGEIFDRRFHSSLGAGFDAHVSKLSNRKTWLRGLPLYLSSVFIGLNSFRGAESTIFVNGREIPGKKLLVTMCNTATDGGGFRLTPKADISDGLLDMMTAEDMKPREVLQVLPKAIFGKHLDDPRVQYEQFKEASILFREPVIIHSDGDILTEKGISMRVRILESALNVIKHNI